MIRAQYTTLTSLRRQKDIGGGNWIAPNSEDSRLQDAIDWASGWITDHTFGRVFVPSLDSFYFRRADVDYGRAGAPLGVPDLLEVTALVNADGTQIASTEYELAPLNTWPKREIELVARGSTRWNFADRSSKGTVTGFWGYHDDYPRAWKAAGSLHGTLDADDTAALISTYAPYEVGDYLKLETAGTQELAQITAIGTVAGSLVGTLILERGVNGTTPIAHGSLTDVPRYQHVRQIQKACNDLAVFYHDNRDSKESSVEVAELAIRLENKIPGRVYTAVQYFARARFEATR